VSQAPNVILIFTDNQQASTLGCYGNPEAYTPNVDQLSAEGTRFDNAFCPNAFCSPCRASVLTGMLPSQHGVHTWIDDRDMAKWPVGWHALNGMRTLPDLLKANGYATALVGKYHLGEPTSPMQGFDHWVTLEDGHVRSFYRNRIIDNGTTYDHEGHSVDFFTAKGIEFIEAQVAKTQPFFLYLPYPAPYGHWPATKEADRCRHSARFDDCPMETIPRMGLSREAVAGYDMKQKSSGGGLDFSMLMRAPNDLATLRNYYAQVAMVDDGVGQIVDALDRLDIADNTLLIYTADHGLSVGQHGFWGHGGATFPSNMHHAAHSVPLIMRGPKVQVGEHSGVMVSNMDVFATILDYLGNVRPNMDELVPSRSLVPLLTGDEITWADDAVFSEQEETRVVRTPKWAYFKRFSEAQNFPLDDELYDVERDPGETRNLINDPAFADIRAALDGMITVFFARYARAEADMWSGGKPVQNTERRAFWADAWGGGWGPVYRYEDG